MRIGAVPALRGATNFSKNIEDFSGVFPQPARVLVNPTKIREGRLIIRDEDRLCCRMEFTQGRHEILQNTLQFGQCAVELESIERRSTLFGAERPHHFVPARSLCSLLGEHEIGNGLNGVPGRMQRWIPVFLAREVAATRFHECCGQGIHSPGSTRFERQFRSRGS